MAFQCTFEGPSTHCSPAVKTGIAGYLEGYETPQFLGLGSLLQVSPAKYFPRSAWSALFLFDNNLFEFLETGE
jgi:hypothetical protein